MTATKRKVLIVDDNRDLLPIFAHLSDEEIQFVVAANGLDALASLERRGGGIDAVLLDLSMSPLDGIAVVEEIRRNEQIKPNGKPLRVAFFTSQTVDGVIDRVQRANNVERVFSKPFDPFELVKSIKGWLN